MITAELFPVSDPSEWNTLAAADTLLAGALLVEAVGEALEFSTGGCKALGVAALTVTDGAGAAVNIVRILAAVRTKQQLDSSVS